MPWDPTLKARPTVYNGIRMRSRLEAGYAAWLDGHGARWEYEPCAFSGKDGRQYLPDFCIHDVWVLGRRAPSTVYVEVKPAEWAEEESNHDAYIELLHAMATIYESEPEAVLLLDSPAPNDCTDTPTGILLWEEIVRMHWPHTATWCSVNTRQTRAQLGLALSLSRRFGPWFEDWWKGQVVR